MNYVRGGDGQRTDARSDLVRIAVRMFSYLVRGARVAKGSTIASLKALSEEFLEDRKRNQDIENDESLPGQLPGLGILIHEGQLEGQASRFSSS